MDRDLSCRELVEFLDDYLAHALAGDALARFEKHLSDCPPCVAYLRTYEQSIRMSVAKPTRCGGGDPRPLRGADLHGLAIP